MCVNCLFTLIECLACVRYTLFDYRSAGDVISIVVLNHYIPNVGFIAGLSLSDRVSFVCNHSLNNFQLVSHKVPLPFAHILPYP